MQATFVQLSRFAARWEEIIQDDLSGFVTEMKELTI